MPTHRFCTLSAEISFLVRGWVSGCFKKKKKNMRSASPSLASLFFCQHKLALVGRSQIKKKKEEGEEEEREAIGKDARRTCLIARQPFGQSITSTKGGGGGGSVHPRPDLLSFPTPAGPALSCVQASPWSLHFSLFERKRPTRDLLDTDVARRGSRL